MNNRERAEHFASTLGFHKHGPESADIYSMLDAAERRGIERALVAADNACGPRRQESIEAIRALLPIPSGDPCPSGTSKGLPATPPAKP